MKVYVDASEKAKKDWKAPLGADEFVGQAEFQGHWQEGYGAMTVRGRKQGKEVTQRAGVGSGPPTARSRAARRRADSATAS